MKIGDELLNMQRRRVERRKLRVTTAALIRQNAVKSINERFGEFEHDRTVETWTTMQEDERRATAGLDPGERDIVCRVVSCGRDHQSASSARSGGHAGIRAKTVAPGAYGIAPPVIGQPPEGSQVAAAVAKTVWPRGLITG